MVQQTIEKVKLIQERMRTAQSRQKSYLDKRRKDLEYCLISYMFGCLWMFLCVVVDLLFSDINAFCFVCGFPSYELIDEEASTRQVLFFFCFVFCMFHGYFFSEPDIFDVV